MKILICSICSCLASVSAASAQKTTRASLGSNGAQGDHESFAPALSADGRYVAFYSEASTLVPGDTNDGEDAFVRDRLTGVTVRVSVDSAGNEADGDSYDLAISARGRYVAFYGEATNLVAGDTNAADDVFVHDLVTKVTTRVSVDSSGAQGDGGSLYPSLSADGRFVAFQSRASNLVPGDTNGASDVFVHDRWSGTTTRVSVDSAGVQGDWDSTYVTLSADGRRVVFESGASNLVPGDTNGRVDIFVRDLSSGITTRVSVDANGVQGNGTCAYSSISANGRIVGFESSSSNLVAGDTNGFTDSFVHDVLTGMTERVSVGSNGVQGNSISLRAVMSAHGRFVMFKSTATNLVAGDTNGQQDIFLRDRVRGTTTRVSVDSHGVQAAGRSSQPAISADGRHLAYYSFAENLVPDDTNGTADVFVQSFPRFSVH